MAELRTTEETVQRLRLVYANLQRRSAADSWPQLAEPQQEQGDKDTTESLAVQETSQTQPTGTAAAVLQELNTIREKMQSSELETKMEKFHKRLKEKDPVTDKPRYGEKTQQRVQQLLQDYEELAAILGQIYGDNNKNNETPTEAAISLENLKNQAAKEHQEQQRARQLQREAQAKARAAAEREREARLEMERQTMQAAEAERLRQRVQVENEARRVMQAERNAATAAARADQEWQAGIVKGADGVRQQLQAIMTATAADKVTQRVAVEALHMIFSQIVARPEEVNYRRIRRNHPKFEADIGRHPGGKEILIAAGFRLGTIDEVPSYISTEPDVEKDMEAWGEWYDLLKETVAIVEEALIQL